MTKNNFGRDYPGLNFGRSYPAPNFGRDLGGTNFGRSLGGTNFGRAIDITAPVVSPSSASIYAGATQQFTANIPVTWSVVGGSANGTITTGGLYTAPMVVSSFTVRATSVTDPAKVTDTIVTTAYTYLHRATFAQAIAAPLPASLPIDVGGPAAVVDGSSVMSQSGGALVVNGTPAATSNLSLPVLPRVIGRAWFWKVPARTTIVSGNVRFGFGSDALDNALDAGIDYSSTTAVRIKRGTAVVDTVTLGAGEHHFALIMRSAGAFLFARNGTSGTYTLLWVYHLLTSAEYAKLHLVAGSALSFTDDDWRALDFGLYDSRFTADYGLATGYQAVGSAAFLSATADCWVTYNLAYVLAVTDANIRLRSAADSLSYWRLRALTTGQMILYEFPIGGPLTARATVAGVFPSTGSYRVAALCDGSTIKVFVTDPANVTTLPINYASATLNQTETRILPTNPSPSTMTDIATWPRTATLLTGADA